MRKLVPEQRLELGELIHQLRQQQLTYSAIIVYMPVEMSSATVRRIHLEYLAEASLPLAIPETQIKTLPWYKKLWHWLNF